MKTMVEICDAVLADAKRLALAERTTLRALIEEGLRRLIAERKRRGNFPLPRASFRGNGLRPGVRDGSWDAIRELIYEGRGA